ncbi:MAG: PucC family protein, partial [Pseudomonadota bacterium]
SAVAFAGLVAASFIGPAWPLQPNVFFLGFANGAFAVAAIGSMMGLANQGEAKREGTRMGLWGAAQALAFGLGGFLGTVAIDVARALLETPATAYGAIFMGEAILFLVSGAIALKVAPNASLSAERAMPRDDVGRTASGPLLAGEQPLQPAE